MDRAQNTQMHNVHSYLALISPVAAVAYAASPELSETTMVELPASITQVLLAVVVAALPPKVTAALQSATFDATGALSVAVMVFDVVVLTRTAEVTKVVMAGAELGAGPRLPVKALSKLTVAPARAALKAVESALAIENVMTPLESPSTVHVLLPEGVTAPEIFRAAKQALLVMAAGRGALRVAVIVLAVLPALVSTVAVVI